MAFSIKLKGMQIMKSTEVLDRVNSLFEDLNRELLEYSLNKDIIGKIDDLESHKMLKKIHKELMKLESNMRGM